MSQNRPYSNNPRERSPSRNERAYDYRQYDDQPLRYRPYSNDSPPARIQARNPRERSPEPRYRREYSPEPRYRREYPPEPRYRREYSPEPRYHREYSPEPRFRRAYSPEPRFRRAYSPEPRYSSHFDNPPGQRYTSRQFERDYEFHSQNNQHRQYHTQEYSRSYDRTPAYDSDVSDQHMVGKQLPSAQTTQDHDDNDAYSEAHNSKTDFKDKSGLIPFFNQASNNLALVRNSDKENDDRRQLYQRLGELSVFRHFPELSRSDLNASQYEALTEIFNTTKIVVAVEGPPGTGKSKVIKSAISNFKVILPQVPKSAWYNNYNDRLSLQQSRGSEIWKKVPITINNEDRRLLHGRIPSNLKNGNETKPMILVLTRTNVSKLHLAETDTDLSTSIVLGSTRSTTFEGGLSSRVRVSCLAVGDFETVQQTIEALKGKMVMYATMNAFPFIAENFLTVANVQCIILDECNLVYSQELSSLLSSFFLVPKVVLFGDSKQLPPSVKGWKPIKKGQVQPDVKSALEVVSINASSNDFLRQYIQRIMLKQSYRLPKNLLSLLSHERYDSLLRDAEGSLIPIQDVDCKNELLFYEYDGQTESEKEKKVKDYVTWYNLSEADAVATLLLQISLSAPRLIRHTKVLTFYSGQKERISNLLKESDNFMLRELVQRDSIVSTIDAFQGKKDDIIILCPTRLIEQGDYEHFLMDLDRLTVAFSRAKKFLVFMTQPGQMSEFKKARNRGCEHLMYSFFEKGNKQSGEAAKETFRRKIEQIALETQ